MLVSAYGTACTPLDLSWATAYPLSFLPTLEDLRHVPAPIAAPPPVEDAAAGPHYAERGVSSCDLPREAPPAEEGRAPPTADIAPSACASYRTTTPPPAHTSIGSTPAGEAVTVAARSPQDRSVEAGSTKRRRAATRGEDADEPLKRASPQRRMGPSLASSRATSPLEPRDGAQSPVQARKRRGRGGRRWREKQENAARRALEAPRESQPPASASPPVCPSPSSSSRDALKDLDALVVDFAAAPPACTAEKPVLRVKGAANAAERSNRRRSARESSASDMEEPLRKRRRENDRQDEPRETRRSHKDPLKVGASGDPRWGVLEELGRPDGSQFACIRDERDFASRGRRADSESGSRNPSPAAPSRAPPPASPKRLTSTRSLRAEDLKPDLHGVLFAHYRPYLLDRPVEPKWSATLFRLLVDFFEYCAPSKLWSPSPDALHSGGCGHWVSQAIAAFQPDKAAIRAACPLGRARGFERLPSNDDALDEEEVAYMILNAPRPVHILIRELAGVVRFAELLQYNERALLSHLRGLSRPTAHERAALVLLEWLNTPARPGRHYLFFAGPDGALRGGTEERGPWRWWFAKALGGEGAGVKELDEWERGKLRQEDWSGV
ncbi:hypothetical protein JCM10450v2_005809 [Rhodotorula kratochvilovae]